MFEAIYIADPKNTLAYEYLVFQHVPTFLALVHTVNTKFNNHTTHPVQLVETSKDYFICSYSTGKIIIYLLCLRRDIGDAFNPLAPFVFIDKLVETMVEYFGLPLTTTKITANNDTLALLLHQMVADGVPHVTEFNNLKDIVLLKTFLLKILHTGNQLASAANNKSLASLANNGLPSSSSVEKTSTVPWRRANARYTNNEMFVDVTETINVILRPKKTKKSLRLSLAQNFDSAFYSTLSFPSGKRLLPVTGTISGKVDFLSRITGVPELQILFNSAKTYLETPQFHRCINLDAWRNSKSLSFIPADGQSTLMTYQVDLDSLSEKTQLGMLGILDFDLQTDLGIHQDEFELKITTLKHQAVSKIEKIHVEMFAYEPSTNESDGASSVGGAENTTNGIDKMKAIRVTDGDFSYKGNGCGHWDIKSLQTGSQPIIRVAILTLNDGTGNDSTNEENDGSTDEFAPVSEHKRHPASPLWFKVSFAYKGQLPSGLKVDSLKLISAKGLGESVKPYKGVKYITQTGDYSIRGH